MLKQLIELTEYIMILILGIATKLNKYYFFSKIIL